mgnify:CR=1 FL=1
MSVEITGTYLGDKKVQLTHGPSGAQLITAAPIDNMGDGSSFSPTDLTASSLGACMLTLIGIVAERHGLDVTGTTVKVEKEMNDSPRRIGKLPVEIRMSKMLSPEDRAKLERAALTCPVHQSLHPEIESPVSFVYDLA